MAVSSSAVTVTNSATALNAASDSDSRAGFSVLVYNNGSSTVYIGGPSVTSTTGVPLTASNSISVDVYPGDVLYGITASGSVSCIVLSAGV